MFVLGYRSKLHFTKLPIRQMASQKVTLAVSEFRDTIVNVLKLEGHDSTEADTIADTLMYAELRSNNQGIIKLIAGALVKDKSATSISTKFETPISCQLDGGHLCGMVCVKRAVDIALTKAAATGISIVGVSNYASATGALGHWSTEIANKGFISIVMSQCNEMVAPHGSYEPIFGTNPVAIGIPTKRCVVPLNTTYNGESAANKEGKLTEGTAADASEEGSFPIVLDMATSAYAWYGVVMASEAGLPIAGDIGYDKEGRETTNPLGVLLGGCLRSFDRSYKGSHLGLMVELLAGAFTGASMTNKKDSKNWGTVVLCIHPDVLGDQDGFIARVKEMCDRVKNAKRLPSATDTGIWLPGERGALEMNEHVRSGMIDVSADLWTKLNAMKSR